MREKFIKLRQLSTLSQKQVWEFLGVDQSNVSKIEKGERPLTLELAEKFALLYCHDLSYLLEDKELNPIKFSFRAQTLTKEDLNSISTVNKIVVYLKEMKELDDDSNNE